MSLGIVSDYFEKPADSMRSLVEWFSSRAGLSSNELESYLMSVINKVNKAAELINADKSTIIKYLKDINDFAGGQFVSRYNKFSSYALNLANSFKGFGMALDYFEGAVNKYNSRQLINSERTLLIDLSRIISEETLDSHFDLNQGEAQYYIKSIYDQEGLKAVITKVNDLITKLSPDNNYECISRLNNWLSKANNQKVIPFFHDKVKSSINSAKSYLKGFNLSADQLIDSDDPSAVLNSSFNELKSKLKDVLLYAKSTDRVFAESCFGTALCQELLGDINYFIKNVEDRYLKIDSLINVLSADLPVIKDCIKNSNLTREQFINYLMPALQYTYEGLETPLTFISDLYTKIIYCSKSFNKAPSEIISIINDKYLGVNNLEDYYNIFSRLELLIKSSEKLFPPFESGEVVVIVRDLAGQEMFRPTQGSFLVGADVILYTVSLDELNRINDLNINRRDIIPFMQRNLGPDYPTGFLLTKADKLFNESAVSSLSDLINEFNIFDSRLRQGLEGYLNQPLFTKPTSAVISTMYYGVNASIWLPILLLNNESSSRKKVFNLVLGGPGASGKSTLMRAYMLISKGVKLVNYGRTEYGDFISFKISDMDFTQMREEVELRDKKGKVYLPKITVNSDGKPCLELITPGESKSHTFSMDVADKLLKEVFNINKSQLFNYDLGFYLEMAAAINATNIKLNNNFCLTNEFLSKNYLINPLIISSKKKTFENYVSEFNFTTLQEFDELFGYKGTSHLLEFAKKSGALFNLSKLVSAFANENGISRQLLFSRINNEFSKRVSAVNSDSLEDLFVEVMKSYFKDYELNLELIRDKLLNIVNIDLNEDELSAKIEGHIKSEAELSDADRRAVVAEFLTDESLKAVLQKVFTSISKESKDQDELITNIADRLCVDKSLLASKFKH